MNRPAHTDADPHALLRAALDFARVGVPVFPCAPGGKRPLTKHGFHDATSDQVQIQAWWNRAPTANLAIPTGRASVDVLDIDIHGTASGYPTLQLLLRAGVLDGWTRMVATPSGGMHIWFPGTEQHNSSIRGHAIDFRATGGYVLVPPSVIHGRAYETVRRRQSPGVPLDWNAVHGLLVPPTTTTLDAPQLGRGIEALAEWVARLPEGERNTGTFWAACRAAEAGHADLRPLLNAAVDAGLPLHEASRTIRSAVRTVRSEQPTRSAPAPPGRAPRHR